MRLTTLKVVTLVLLGAALLVPCLAQAPTRANAAAAPAAAPAAAAQPAPAPAPAAAAKPTGPVPPEQMDGVDFSGLTAEQKALAVSILNENSCDCSCGMKIAVCRRDDAKCGRSLALAKQVVDLVKAGKTRQDIVKIALSPPSKFVQFPLPPGDAPAAGPKDAKVTILFYLDYQ